MFNSLLLWEIVVLAAVAATMLFTGQAPQPITLDVPAPDAPPAPESERLP